MALSLNTSHALYANVLALIAVDDDGVVKDIKTPIRALGKDTDCTIGTGTYGRHFETAPGADNFSYKGIAVSPSIDFSSTTGCTLFFAANDMIGSTGSCAMLDGNGVNADPVYVTNKIRTSATSDLSASSVNVGSHTFSTGRNGDALWRISVDGAVEVDSTGTGPGFSGDGGHITGIGGVAGQSSVQAQIVYFVVFDKYLSAAEITELHSSLTGSNAFSLVSSGSTPATGTLGWTEDNDATAIIADVAGTVSASISWTEANDTAALTGTVTAATGTITTPVLKNNTGTVLANETGVTVNVYNSTTGALIVQKTGQTSDASGIVTVSDALIIDGTTYAYEVVLASNGRRLPTAAAT